jgi:hypothetical protein
MPWTDPGEQRDGGGKKKPDSEDAEIPAVFFDGGDFLFLSRCITDHLSRLTDLFSPITSSQDAA